jgi:hypothetical protein
VCNTKEKKKKMKEENGTHRKSKKVKAEDILKSYAETNYNIS